ncbi:MAG TPA: ATP-binding protein [Mucilaginibacter sp.]
MHVFYFIAAFLLLARLNKSFADPVLKLKWNQTITYGNLGIGILFIVSQIAVDGAWQSVIGVLTLAGILFYLYKEPDFSPFNFFIQAHYPLVVVGIISSVVQLVNIDFYGKWSNYFDFAILGAFGWIYARWISSKKQRQEMMVVAARNAQLDVLVAQRTAELTQQKNELQETVKLLQATQEQLIQQEKLASLGELTAGIAHEIQNPLNFVNNFSEVSMELVDEMGEEITKGDIEEAKAIANDIKQNLEKIIHHGKRADAIVKNMLQHSRSNSGEKQPTDINALADEYLRLSYHGLRAKDKMFNSNMITELDPALPKLNVISQDIGRVLLNLFNNAFYAVQQRHKTEGDSYKPEVKVSTALKGKFVEISVTDNGTGIPDAVKDKILQPFFTTKPTGEGTGLGLSLSYDIVVKGHAGKMEINSKEGEFTEFLIRIPV